MASEHVGESSELKWVSIPLPDGVTDEVYAAVTEDLTEDEKRALGQYVDWYRRQHYVPPCPTCGGTREGRRLVAPQPPRGVSNWHGPPGAPCDDAFHDEEAVRDA